ncbi:N-acetyltransferase [Streptomyces pluripotens]|uniref:N-acetyltransferase n=1 Tax=Streptomyces pluripotens TaxID=1355015 RepID=A0A221NTL1_9ACTN|nr:GNAT family N-acetyltransferase [Streptomyces pluripotens]ARP68875.1 N-acetyltransferase [Streptomyces pluripotens]ASN23128.1 N-acetyltransferase [Streptomyces pluripotens]
MIVRRAQQRDFPGFLSLAAEVEHWFGPMVDEPGFHSAVERHIRRSTALVAVSPEAEAVARAGLLGGMLFDRRTPVQHIDWLVVSAHARGRGVGRALVAEAVRRFVQAPGALEVVTFGADHPGAVASGGRVFYERLGFSPAEAREPGPEGGSRQVYRRTVS